MTTRSHIELSIVFPAYNEASSIHSVVSAAVAHLDRRGIDYEIQVVDDGSGDSTREVLDGLRERTPRLRVVRHPVNLGYGAAIRSGIAAARGRHILVSDGDGQFRIEDLDSLWQRRNQADLVLGYRNPRSDRWHRRLAGWLYGRVLVRLVLGGRFHDVNCGFKLISRSVVEEMELCSTGALISAELLTRARLLGATFVEIGVEHFPRSGGRATGLLPRVVLHMLRELFALRSRILAHGRRQSAAQLRTKCDRIESASA